MGKIIKIIFLIILLLWLIGFAIFVVASKNIENNSSYIENSIVLTGGKNRIQEGVTLLDNGSTSLLFISGVNSDVDKQAVLATDFGAHDKDVILGYDATSTKENVIESEKWISENDIEKVRIITSDYHIFRSKLEFNDSMPDLNKVFHSVENINDDFLSSFYNWKVLIREFNKLIYVFIMQGVF